MIDATLIERLRAKEADIRAEGATSLYIYGSRVRGNFRADSDLDIFIDYNALSNFSLFDIAGIKLLLETELGYDVHITTRTGLHPLLKNKIESEAVRVF